MANQIQKREFSQLRQKVIDHFLKEILDFPASASVCPVDAAVWAALYLQRLGELEPAILGGLVVADTLQERLEDAAAPDGQAESIEATLGQARAAAEAESARRQAAGAQSEVERLARRRAFIQWHGLSPEAAHAMGWHPGDELEGLLEVDR
jgi:hypothetical protein